MHSRVFSRCAPSGHGPSCATGTTCRITSGGSSGTCQALATEGQACDDLNGPGCGTLFRCDNATKKCTRYPKAGALVLHALRVRVEDALASATAPSLK